MEHLRSCLAQLLWNYASETTTDMSQGNPQYISATILASVLVDLEMAHNLPLAVQRLRLLKLDPTDYDDVCKLFCDISRISEEIVRHQHSLQSSHLTVEYASAAIRRIHRYLKAYRARLSSCSEEVRSINVPLLRRTSSLSEADIEKAHTQLQLYRKTFDQIAGTFELISETFDDEVYHPFLSQQFGEGDLYQVRDALDSINVCLQQGYDDAQTHKAFVEQTTRSWAAQQRVQSQSRPVRVTESPYDTEKVQDKIESPMRLGEREDEPVAVLRSELERTLGFNTSSSRLLASPTVEAAADPERSQAESAMQARDSATSALHVNGAMSAPLYAGSAVASFSRVEERVYRRGHHNRATTLDSTANYIATNTGMPQLGSVVRTHGRDQPRVFTGSFNELEAGIVRLHIESGGTSPLPNVTHYRSASKSTMVRDFATPAGTGPGTPTSIPPSPATLHFRREALLTGEAELKHPSASRRRKASD